MGLLKPATNQTAFLKAGLMGFEASGKTFTAVHLMIGLTEMIKGNKVAFFDTETGSDFHIHRFKDRNIEMHVVKSRAFRDLCTTIQEAQDSGFSGLIIDSITHVWRDLCDSYLKKKRRNFLTMKDWGILKMEWGHFTDLYVNSKLHICMCGRAGFEYSMEEDDDGKKEIQKTGTKMKVETETGYEPSLLLEMIRVRKSEITHDIKATGFINRCVVLKDRWDIMNGRIIDSPKFEDFLPVIKPLNIGGEHMGVDITRTSEDLFNDPDFSTYEKKKQRDIALEDTKNALIVAGLDGNGADAKKGRVAELEKAFGTASWTAISDLYLNTLIDGLRNLKINLGQIKDDPNAEEDVK